ncbi:snare associated Golgi protein-domain-containing protein, partial [Mycena pura]
MAMPYPAYNPSRPPPQSNLYPPSGPFNPSFDKGPDGIRDISRTPSPTPSEAMALSDGLLSWKQLTDWRFWIRKEWIKYYIILTVILVITALISIYHHQIVDELTPVTKWLHGLKFGWLVPIGVFFVISFPPLFGHEIVAILCGLVWGLWIGFAIVCAGTFIGEVGNFYAFKYCCRARGEKMERTQIPYACLARCVREGGFKIALIARFSAIPGHFTTAVFSTCGMNIFVFSIAAILSLPKQFITVYLGVILEQSDAGTTTFKSKVISDSVLAATFLVTLLAMWYIFHQMALVKPAVIYERRKARQAKLQAHTVDLYGNPALNDSDSSVGGGYDPREDAPLTAKAAGHQQHQQWDAAGNAVGYTPGPVHQVIHAPQPQ